MKRVALRLLLFLLLGAIINVAVAWGCALTTDITSVEPEWITELVTGSHLGWSVTRFKTRGSLTLAAMIQLHSTDAFTLDDRRVPQWSRIKHLPAYREGQPMPMMHDLAFGWPMVSMWYAIDSERDWQSGTVISRSAFGALGEAELPLRPIWPGFAINTIFYAAIVWGLFAVPGYIKRRRRIKRGLCVKCAYPVGTNEKCTECGSQINGAAS